MEGRILQIVVSFIGLGLMAWLFGAMLWNIDWEAYEYGAPFVRFGILAEAAFAIGALCLIVYCGYRILKR